MRQNGGMRNTATPLAQQRSPSQVVSGDPQHKALRAGVSAWPDIEELKWELAL